MEEHKARKDVSFDQLAELREKTEVVSQFLQKLLSTYLKTIQPLLSPGRALGRYAGAKEDVGGADKLFAELQGKYKEVCGKPFGLPSELDKEPLASLEALLELSPWEYLYEAKGERETKALTITSPLRWVLSFRSAYTFAQMRQALSDKAERRHADIRQFVVNALVLHMILNKSPGIVQILTNLRYHVETIKIPEFGALPLTVLSACLTSFRPSDDLLVIATRFSGVPAFIELIDLDLLPTLQDPVKVKIEELLAEG